MIIKLKRQSSCFPRICMTDDKFSHDWCFIIATTWYKTMMSMDVRDLENRNLKINSDGKWLKFIKMIHLLFVWNLYNSQLPRHKKK